MLGIRRRRQAKEKARHPPKNKTSYSLPAQQLQSHHHCLLLVVCFIVVAVMLELLGIHRRRPAKEKDTHPPKNKTGYSLPAQ